MKKNLSLAYLTVIPKHELLLKSRATYPPTFQPGQQSTGPLVSQRSLNWGAERRCVDSTVHMDRIEEWVNRSSEGLQVKNKKEHLVVNKKSKTRPRLGANSETVPNIIVS